jgi:hypothetical protein
VKGGGDQNLIAVFFFAQARLLLQAHAFSTGAFTKQINFLDDELKFSSHVAFLLIHFNFVGLLRSTQV